MGSQDDGEVGPLFAEIIRQQFELLRDGDRFFFTHKEDASTKARGVGPVTKSAILKRTLGAVLCDAIPLDIITSKSRGQSVFKTVGHDNPDLDCSSVEEMDFGSIFEESMRMQGRAGCEASMNVGQWIGRGNNVGGGGGHVLASEGPLDCARLCSEDPTCKAWTLNDEVAQVLAEDVQREHGFWQELGARLAL